LWTHAKAQAEHQNKTSEGFPILCFIAKISAGYNVNGKIPFFLLLFECCRTFCLYFSLLESWPAWKLKRLTSKVFFLAGLSLPGHSSYRFLLGCTA
jgi:hypothetical protein